MQVLVQVALSFVGEEYGHMSYIDLLVQLSVCPDVAQEIASF